MPPMISPISTSGLERLKRPLRSNPSRRLAGEFALEGREQHQRRERRRADRVALGDRLGRVADRVERVGDVADVLGQVGHLGDAAGVVGDRPEGVEGDDQPAERELRHHGDADAVDPRQLVGGEDRQRQDQRRGGGRLEALRQPLDDVGRVAGLRCLGDRLDRSEAGRRIKFGDPEQQRGHRDPDHGAEPEVGDADRVGGGAEAEPHRVAHQPVGDRVEGRDREDPGDDQALVERPLDPVRFGPHRERPDDRGDDRDAADHQRVDRHLAREVPARAGEGEHAEQHHGDRGDRVGLEQVGRHAGTVADVVADVVGDHGRVAGIVLGDPRLDLADQVGADVGRLGEDAAAEPGEDGDQRAAEAEADEGVDSLLVAGAGEDEDAEVAGDAEQGKTDDEQAGHRAALEGDVERRRDAAAGRLGDAGVGPHRDVHPDKAGGAGEDGADHEAERGLVVLQQPEHERDRHRHRGDDRVLAVEVGLGPLLHRARDFLHALVARRLREQALRDDQSIDNGRSGADKRDDDSVFGQEAGQVRFLRWFGGAGVYKGPRIPRFQPGSGLRGLPGGGVGAMRLAHRVAVDVLDRDAAVERLAGALGAVALRQPRFDRQRRPRRPRPLEHAV